MILRHSAALILSALVASTVAAALGDAFPHLEISWISEHLAAPLLENNPYLAEAIALPREWRRADEWNPVNARRYIRSDHNARCCNIPGDNGRNA